MKLTTLCLLGLSAEKALYMKTKAKSLTPFDVFVNICMCFMMTFRITKSTTLSYCAYNQAKYSHLTLLIISMFVSSIFSYRPIFLIPSICIIFLFSCPKSKTMTYMLACTYLVLYINILSSNHNW